MEIKRLKFLDKSFLITLFIIIVFGIVILSSATLGISSDPYYYLKKQLTALILGIIAVFFLIRYDYTQLSRFSKIIYVVSIILLVAVLFFGQEAKGSTRAIALGPFPAIQPSEFTKIFIILAFADFLNRRRGELNTLMQLLPCFLFMLLPFMIIMMQPDLGTSLVYIAITISMMFIAGANPKIMLSLIMSGVIMISLVLFLHFNYDMWVPLDDYQIKRLTSFVDPYNDGYGGRGSGWNTIQSLIAVGSGGLIGKGLYNGTQVQLNFLPEHHTDFIYAVIGEEFGFIGASILIILFGILFMRAMSIAYNSRDLYGTLIVVGIIAMWVFHVFENIGMCIGVMPITGLPLPFISFGGSSLLSNLIAVGLILSINIRGKKIVF